MASLILQGIALLAVAAIFGSFINLVASRWPHHWHEGAYTESWRWLVVPRSHCNGCKRPLSFWQLIPLVGYVWQKGRCCYCQSAIGRRHWVVELLLPVVWGLLWWRYSLSGEWLVLALLTAALLLLAVLDWETGILPNALTLGLLWGGLMVHLAFNEQAFAYYFWTAVVAYVLLNLLAQLMRWILKRDAIGGGDVKLIAALGACLGPEPLLGLVFLAAALGLLASISVLAWQRMVRARGEDSPAFDWSQEIPFAPSLALAALIVVLR